MVACIFQNKYYQKSKRPRGNSVYVSDVNGVNQGNLLYLFYVPFKELLSHKLVQRLRPLVLYS